VEEAIGERVRLEPRDGRRRVAGGAREHVMPLQDLVQQDAVDEAAEAHAEQDAGPPWRRRRTDGGRTRAGHVGARYPVGGARDARGRPYSSIEGGRLRSPWSLGESWTPLVTTVVDSAAHGGNGDHSPR
jgi:hypothetical protein